MDSDKVDWASQPDFQVTSPLQCTKIKIAKSNRGIYNTKPKACEMAAEQAAPISGPQPAPKLKQMLLTDRFRQHIGDCLPSDLLNDEPG